MLLVLITFGLVEVTAWVGLGLLKATGRIAELAAANTELTANQRDRIRAWIETGGQYVTHSAVLGWTIRPNGEVDAYRANGQGARSDREFSVRPPDGKIRIASFGDSFTHGAEVGFPETWQARLEESDPSWEVLNFGVNAYGLDQSYLRYMNDGRRFDPDIVLVGFMSENINRQVSVFRAFYQPQTGMPFTKPRFDLRLGRLRLLPNPIPEIEGYRALLDNPEETMRRIGKHDHYFLAQSDAHPSNRLASIRLIREVSRRLSGNNRLSPGFKRGAYEPSSEAYRVTERVLDRFYQDVSKNGSLPIVLLFPNRADLVRQGSGEPPSYQPLIDHMNRLGYRWIDLLEPLARVDSSTLFTEGGHYTPAGHREVAVSISAYLQSRGLDDRSGMEAQQGE
jgi:hypothetical protein